MTLHKFVPVGIILGCVVIYTCYVGVREFLNEEEERRAWEAYKRTVHYQDDLRWEAAKAADPR